MVGVGRDLGAYGVPELLELFVASIREYESIDHTWRKNRLHAKRSRIVEAIKARSDGTLRVLLPLLNDPDPALRLTVAIYYKSVERDAALVVIKELAQRKDAVGREAQHSLEMEKFFEEHPFTPPPEKEVPSPSDSRLSGHKPPPGITRDELEPMLFDAFPRETASALLALARPAIRIWPQRLVPNAPATCSRLGGLPAMPRDWMWPTVDILPKGDWPWLNQPREKWPKFEQEPRWFIGQINCAEVVDLVGSKALPREGLLFFFADGDVVTGCTGGGDDNGIFYWPTAERLETVTAPVEDFNILPSCGLGFVDALDLPHPFSGAIKALALSKELMDRYWDVREAVSNYGVVAKRFQELDRSKIFGWPDLVQGELETLADAKKPRRLFAQIGNYDNGRESHWWGPGGLVYYVIDDANLAKGEVTRAFCDFQCS